MVDSNEVVTACWCRRRPCDMEPSWPWSQNIFSHCYHIVIVDILSMQGLIFESSLKNQGVNIPIGSGALKDASLWFSKEKD